MRILMIDPSKNNVGWATLNTGCKKRERAWKWGTWHPQGHNLQMRMVDLAQTIEAEIPEFDFLITEKPMFFSSERGQVAAHQNYTIDLAAISYFIAGWFKMDHRRHFPITANQWKGQVTKEITARRFFAAFPKIEKGSLSEHAIDAVMLGRWTIENYFFDLPPALLGSSPESLRSLL